MDTEDRVKELVQFCARALVDEPDEVEVAVVEADRAVIYELTVAPDDRGKVIGKEGRTARALRQLMAAASRRDRAVLDILE